jgi:hypothetical protein
MPPATRRVHLDSIKTRPMTAEEYRTAVQALAALIVSGQGRLGAADTPAPTRSPDGQGPS